MKNQISIICQNLNSYKNERFNLKEIEKHINEYINNTKADIYAFQEYPNDNSFCTKFIIKNSDIQFKEVPNNDVQEIWNEVFSRPKSEDKEWKDFRTAYWSEAELTYQGEDIWIINFHCSPSYPEQLCFVLIKHILKLETYQKKIILLGDFNAAEYCQNEVPTIWGQTLYHTITDILEFKELFAEDETLEAPHYTFLYKNTKDEWKQKKLDHIFVNKKFVSTFLDKWSCSISYIDKVNYNMNENDKNAFTDHSGIKFEIKTKDSWNEKNV